ncbi:MAG TPA: hypothetical protein VLF17_02100, partial [Candidatus Nitrosotenuis sp.]|nr:hypothetical protein [Candidatus Nitrosotenuis sp.]
MTNSDKDSVMDDKIVTIQNPTDMTGVSSGYRGKVVIGQDRISETDFESLDKSCPTHSFDYDKKTQALSVDHGKCIACDKCRVQSPALIQIKSSFASASKTR